jgi:hypothetical protein
MSHGVPALVAMNPVASAEAKSHPRWICDPPGRVNRRFG